MHLQCQKERDKEVSDDEAEAETEDKKEESGDTEVSHLALFMHLTQISSKSDFEVKLSRQTIEIIIFNWGK